MVKDMHQAVCKDCCTHTGMISMLHAYGVSRTALGYVAHSCATLWAVFCKTIDPLFARRPIPFRDFPVSSILFAGRPIRFWGIPPRSSHDGLSCLSGPPVLPSQLCSSGRAETSVLKTSLPKLFEHIHFHCFLLHSAAQ